MNFKFLLMTTFISFSLLANAGILSKIGKTISNVGSSIYQGVGAVKDFIVDSTSMAYCHNIKTVDNGEWRSSLYPTTWTPPTSDKANQNYLQDYSYAGYMSSGRSLDNIDLSSYETIDMTKFGADPSRRISSSNSVLKVIQANSNKKNPVVLFFPKGDYFFDSPLQLDGSFIIKGESKSNTRFFFNQSNLREVNNIQFGHGIESNQGLRTQNIIKNAEKFSNYVDVDSNLQFKVGEDINIGWTITDSFRSRHGMSAYWTEAANQYRPIFQRKILRIANITNGKRIYLDLPLRYPINLEDAPIVQQRTYSAKNCGIVDIGITTASASEDDAQNSLFSHAISFKNTKNCFAKNIASFESSGKYHLLNGGILVDQSKNVTIENADMRYSQNRANGGNGYLFIVTGSNEILLQNVYAKGGRHGFVASGWGNSGLVLRKLTSTESNGYESQTQRKILSLPKGSDFHKFIVMGALIEQSNLSDGWMIGNRESQSGGAGQTGTDTIFWNNYGSDSCSTIASFNYQKGYVIGTRNLTVYNQINSSKNNVLKELYGSSVHVGTEADDYVEGVDQGPTLRPESLYSDQLNKRTGN